MRRGENHDESLEELVTNSDDENSKNFTVSNPHMNKLMSKDYKILQSDENQEFLAGFDESMGKDSR